jgi:hypothetical protein
LRRVLLALTVATVAMVARAVPVEPAVLVVMPPRALVPVAAPVLAATVVAVGFLVRVAMAARESPAMRARTTVVTVGTVAMLAWKVPAVPVVQLAAKVPPRVARVPAAREHLARVAMVVTVALGSPRRKPE